MKKFFLFSLLVINTYANNLQQINNEIQKQIGFTNNVKITSVQYKGTTNKIEISELKVDDQIIIVIQFPMKYDQDDVIFGVNTVGYIELKIVNLKPSSPQNIKIK